MACRPGPAISRFAAGNNALWLSPGLLEEGQCEDPAFGLIEGIWAKEPLPNLEAHAVMTKFQARARCFNDGLGDVQVRAPS